MKECKKCKLTLPLDSFCKHKSGKLGRRGRCRECCSEDRLSPEYRRYQREVNLQREFGIGIEEYDELYEEQGGKCAICSTEAKLVVDHCHDSLEVRGLLCSTCNTGLGQFHDSPSKMNKAIQYLLDTGTGK